MSIPPRSPVQNLDTAIQHFWDLKPDMSLRALKVFLEVGKSPGESVGYYQKQAGFPLTTVSQTLRILTGTVAKDVPGPNYHRALLQRMGEGNSAYYSLSPLGVKVWKLLTG